jgi:hypothetical protein
MSNMDRGIAEEGHPHKDTADWDETTARRLASTIKQPHRDAALPALLCASARDIS